MKGLLVLVSLAAPLAAGEYVLLENGFRLHAERHEAAGNVVRLYSREGGVTEIDSARVAGFEAEEAAPTAAERSPGPVPVTAKLAPRDLIDRAARRQGLPPQLVDSVVAAESAHNPKAVSPKGAVGLMQLMPETARARGVDPRDPEQNVEAGAALLRELLIKYDGDANKALAAYNAGEGAVSRYQGVPPYPETVNYVDRVIRRYQRSPGGGEGQR